MNTGEMKELLKDKKIWAFGLLIIILVIGILLTDFGDITRKTYRSLDIPNPEPLPNRVLRVEPLPDATGVSANPTVSITFENSVTGKNVSVSAKPSALFSQNLSTSGYTLTLIPKAPLKLGTKYALAVSIGKTKIYEWEFTTGQKSGNAAIIEALKKKLPYQGAHFRISYAQATDKYFVNIDAKPVETYKKTAIDWLKSQGLTDPEKQINMVYFLIGKASD